MVEFMVDMGCLLEEGELDRVVLHDENGEHPSMLFEPSRGACTNRAERKPASMPMLRCSECGCATTLDVPSGGAGYAGETAMAWPRFCGNCGAKVVRP